MNENTDIFIYSHIPFKPYVKNTTYKVLTHCTDNIDTNLEVYRDFNGDNIGDKNLMYNEYTGYYWIWKNYDIKDNVGLIHYRRYFKWLDNLPDIDFLLTIFKMVISNPLPLKCPLDGKIMNNREWYGWWHNIEDYDILKSVFINKYPEYMDGFNKMENNTEICNSSMFIMPKDTFNEYCEFIFSVLDDYIKETGLYTVDDCIKHVENNEKKYMKTKENCGYDLPYYDVRIQSRIIGYIAERAMNAYILNGNKSLMDNAIKEEWFETRNNY